MRTQEKSRCYLHWYVGALNWKMSLISHERRRTVLLSGVRKMALFSPLMRFLAMTILVLQWPL